MRLVRLLLSLGFLALAGVMILGLSIVLAAVDFYGRDLPDHMTLKTYVPRLGSTLIAADGTFLSRRADQRRTFVAETSIPRLVEDAFISAEDQNFRKHSGVDFVAIARAFAMYLAHKRVSGASTIDQQVAKNLLVGSEKTASRKIREAILAVRMDRDLGKNRILEIYLNEIYLGQGAYGVQAAADTYFAKPLDRLQPEEVAMLAALPKAPSSINPVVNPARALERRNYVLRRMAEDGYIDASKLSYYTGLPIKLARQRNREEAVRTNSGWLEDLAWQDATEMLGSEMLGSQDLVIKTTQKPNLQTAAEAALREGVLRADESLGWRGPIAHVSLPVDWDDPVLTPPVGAEDLQLVVVEDVGKVATLDTSEGDRLTLDAAGVKWTGRSLSAVLKPGDVVLVNNSGHKPELAQMPEVDGAMVVLDPHDGAILAIVGGFSHERSVFNRASQARRQPGSAFKPIVYSTALTLGYDATSPLLDAPIALDQGPGQEDWRPADARTAGNGGLITVRRALENSRNLATVRLVWTIGLDDVEAMAERFGFDFDNDKMTYAAALGVMEVSPLQLASAYCAFANGGYLPDIHEISEVSSRDGKMVRRFGDAPPSKVLDPIVAAQMNSILRGVVERGTAATAFTGFKQPLAGKTGTTNGSRDAWFVGFTGGVVMAVWIGRDNDEKLADGETGGRLAAPVVRDFLDRVGDAVSYAQPPIPDGVTMVTVDPATGLPAKTGIQEILRLGADGTLPMSVVADVPRRARRPSIEQDEIPAIPSRDSEDMPRKRSHDTDDMTDDVQ